MRPYPPHLHRCMSSPFAISARDGSGCFARNVCACSAIAGKQKPHCPAAAASNARTICERSSADSPSSVSTSPPSTSTEGSVHVTRACPFTIARHAPHCP